MNEPHLYMLLLGASYPGRTIEQHDMFFSIGTSPASLVPEIRAYWPEAGAKLHVDAWRRVSQVDGYDISVVPRSDASSNPVQLFFLNLGGYKANEFDEYHYRMLVAATDKGTAIQQAKQTAFYRHTGYKGAESHIDDRFGVDVDDIVEINEILAAPIKAKYSLRIIPATEHRTDELHLGYFKLDKLAGAI